MVMNIFVHLFVKLLAIGQLEVELMVIHILTASKKIRTSWHHGILMVIGKGVDFCASEHLLFACNFLEFGRGLRQRNRQLCCELEELQQLQNLYEGEHGTRSQDS